MNHQYVLWNNLAAEASYWSILPAQWQKIGGLNAF